MHGKSGFPKGSLKWLTAGAGGDSLPGREKTHVDLIAPVRHHGILTRRLKKTFRVWAGGLGQVENHIHLALRLLDFGSLGRRFLATIIPAAGRRT